MPLIGATSLKALTDIYAGMYERWTASAGDLAAPVAGTDAYLSGRGATLLGGFSDFDQMHDMGGAVSDARVDRARMVAAFLRGAIDAMDGHVDLRSGDLDLLGLPDYLEYLNATPYSCLIHPSYGKAYATLGGVLPPGGMFQPAIPDMGRRAVGGSFVAGAAGDVLYACPTGLVEVMTDFSGGSAPPSVTVAGIDDTGVNTTTWTATLGSDDPVSAISTTITPAVTSHTRVNVAVASVTGIVVGSILVVNAGLIDEESVIVEAVISSTITCVFSKGHLAGAALTGKSSVLLTPSVSGRRIASVTGITIGITGHAAGAVRVCGIQERQYGV